MLLVTFLYVLMIFNHYRSTLLTGVFAISTFRETLQAVFLEVLNLFSGQFSICVPRNDSGEHRRKSLYDEHLILVKLILVNFFRFLVITRYHGSFFGRH